MVEKTLILLMNLSIISLIIISNTKLIQQNIFEEPSKPIINSGEELSKIKE